MSLETWSLDHHPILEKFRPLMNSVRKDNDRFYYLLLPPLFALTQSKYDPLDYLFYSETSEPLLAFCMKSKKAKFIIDEGKSIQLLTGFDSKIKCPIPVLMNTACTSTNGFSFTLYELLDDPYHHVETPPLCTHILDIYDDPVASDKFLEKELNNKELQAKLAAFNNFIQNTPLTPENHEDFVNDLHIYIEEVAQIVFTYPPIHTLPVAVKTKINYIIYNSLATKCHFRLLRVYGESYIHEDEIAQKASRKVKPTPADEEKMQQASLCLKGILYKTTPGDAVKAVVKFFDAVVAALHGAEIAADDILPAICAATSKNPGFDSHIYSFFTYLAENWPSQGLDDRTNYILITCSIAASHLSIPPAQTEPEPEKQSTKNDQTISMLEDILSII